MVTQGASQNRGREGRHRREATFLVEQPRVLAEHSPDVIVRVDRELKHGYVNSSAAPGGKRNADEALRVSRNGRDCFERLVGPWQRDQE